MKKHLFIVIAMAAISVLLLNACSKEVQDPVLALEKNSIEISFEGGALSISYSLENPLEGASVQAGTNVEWISDFNCNVKGTITFNVAKNTDMEPRTAEVFVLYPGLITPVAFTVHQSNDENRPAPELKLSQSEIVVDPQGWDYTVDYEILNPIIGVSPKANPDVDWISGIKCGGSGITFVTADNEGEQREGVITITYKNAASNAILKVIQGAPIPEPFTFEENELTEIQAKISVAPQEKEMTYLVFYKSRREMVAEGLISDEAIFQYDIAFLHADAENWGDPFSASVEYYSKKGDAEITMFPVVPGEEYVLYVYGIQMNGEEDPTRLTDVFQYSFVPRSVPMVEADFNIDLTVHGTDVDFIVTSNGFSGPFIFDVLDAPVKEEDLYFEATKLWLNITEYYFEDPECTPADIIEFLCYYDTVTDTYSLDAETEYVVFACAIDEKIGLPCSQPCWKSFKTESDLRE